MKEQKYCDMFIECLKKAGKNIEAGYFKIIEAGTLSVKFRERIYCYELYHQLRILLGNKEKFPYMLHGELDKKGYQIFNALKLERIPDFLVHVPGNMEDNLVVMEVKNIDTQNHKIKPIIDDMKKVKNFIEKAKYYRGIMLIYSDGIKDFPDDLKKQIYEDFKEEKEKVFLFWHNGPNKQIQKIELDE